MGHNECLGEKRAIDGIGGRREREEERKGKEEWRRAER